jgi:hypothetical protein
MIVMKELQNELPLTVHNVSRGRLCALWCLALFICLLSLPTTTRAQHVLSNIWSKGVGSETWLANDNAHRGIAVSPTTNHVYVVSRTGGDNVYILDALDGSFVGTLDMTGVGGGTFGANLVEVGEDGAIYVCNLATAPGFKIYRWENESSMPVNIYIGDPTINDTNAVVTNSKRFGDTIDVRGSGTNTQIIVNSRAGRASGIIFPNPDVDLTIAESWLAQTVLLDAPNNTTGTGVAWAEGNAFWAKQASNPLRKLQIANPEDLGNISLALVATTAVSYATSAALPATTSGLGALTASNLIAVIDYSGHFLRLFSTSAGLATEDVGAFPLPVAADGNGVGTADFVTYTGGTYVYGINVNNGIAAFKVVPVVTPIISSGPADQTILDGGYGPLTIIANGSPPLFYYWRSHGIDGLSTNLLAVTTNSGTLNLTNVTQSIGGYFSVVVSNAAGSLTSTNAFLTIAPTVQTAAMTPLWKLAGGARPYLSTADLTRGIAVNPANGHLLVVTRVGGANIHVLDGATGADLWQMDTDPSIVTGSSPSGFNLNVIGVADDGAVYACNLNTGGANTRVYRWDSDSASSVPVGISINDATFGGLGRFGDTIAVRGAGTNTQILLRSQDQPYSIVLRTFDGVNFYATVLSEDPVAADDNTRLGLAFGAGNTYWTKGTTNLFHFAFDPDAGTTTLLQAIHRDDFPSLGYPIGVDPENDLLARVATINQTPDNLGLYDIHDSTLFPVLVDQEFFESDNGNINAVGAVDFDIARGRVFALNNNNGIVAMNVVARLKQIRQGNQLILSWTGPSALQSASSVTGPYTDVPAAVSPHTNNISGTVFFRLRR